MPPSSSQFHTRITTDSTRGGSSSLGGHQEFSLLRPSKHENLIASMDDFPQLRDHTGRP